MILKREIEAVAAVLADEDNDEMTAEQVAEAAIRALDDLRATTNRLAVVASYAWHPDEEPTLAVLGPFSTLAKAAARRVGGEMRGTVRGGRGKWMLVPAYANVKAAWDAVAPDPAGEAERRLEAALGTFWKRYPATYQPLAGDWARCCCGLRAGGYCLVHKKVNPPR